MTKAQERASLAHAAYDNVRQRIVRGELEIGQVISRRKIASELGMSFLPVSEALQRLEVEGLLESRPRAGTRIRIPTRADIVGHYTVREALEVQAARLFAEEATGEECEEITKLAEKVDLLRAKPNNRTTYSIAHEKLHRRIAECTRCPALVEALSRVHALASTWMCTGHPSGTGANSRHRDLVAALVTRDVNEASAAMRKHIIVSRETAIERLQPYFRMHRKQGKTFARGERTVRLIAQTAR